MSISAANLVAKLWLVGTLAHDVAHLPITIGGLAVLTGGLVHDAEAAPGEGRMGIAQYQIARCSVGVREFSSLDQLDGRATKQRSDFIVEATTAEETTGLSAGL